MITLLELSCHLKVAPPAPMGVDSPNKPFSSPRLSQHFENAKFKSDVNTVTQCSRGVWLKHSDDKPISTVLNSITGKHELLASMSELFVGQRTIGGARRGGRVRK